MLGEEPACQDHVFHLVLLVFKSELIVEIEQSLALVHVCIHALVVKVNFRCNSLQMFLIEVCSVAKAFNSPLVRPKLKALKAKATLGSKAELLIGMSTINDRHAVTTTPTRTHIV